MVSQRIANLEAGLAALAGSEALNEARDKAQSELEENNTRLREFQVSLSHVSWRALTRHVHHNRIASRL